MKSTINRIAFKVYPRAERSIRSRHPWVFEESIKKQNKEGIAGDIAVIFDNKKNAFLACGLYDPDSFIRIKLLVFDSSEQINEDWFTENLNLALEKRKELLSPQQNSFRWIYGESDNFPHLVLDVYGDSLVIKIYSLIWEPYLEAIIKSINACLKIDLIVVRLARKIAQKSAYKDGQIIQGNSDNAVVQFLENGLHFETNLISGHKTGYFLDQRANRKLIESYASNKKVLDVFSYTGGFAVHALKGGASKVLALDISNKALQTAERNAKINGFEDRLETITGDAFKVMLDLKKRNLLFDIIVVDPPSFAKQVSEIAPAKERYKELISLTIPLVEKNGMVLLASCSSRISAEEFYEICFEKLNSCQRSYHIISQNSHDIDHPISIPESAYLKALFIEFTDP